MGNVLDKGCRENENTHFMFNNVFPKIVPFEMSKNVVETEGHKRLHNMAHRVAC
jgi:hypothetical protein